MKITKLKLTCDVCPTQYEGWTDNNEFVYIRYRYGFLSISVSGYVIYSEQIGNGLDGFINLKDIIKLTKDIIDWSDINEI